MLSQALWKFLEPLRRLRAKWFRVKAAPLQAKADLRRAQQLGKGTVRQAKQAKGDMKGMAGKVRGASNKARGAVGQVQGQMPGQAPVKQTHAPQGQTAGQWNAAPQQAGGMAPGAINSAGSQEAARMNPMIEKRGFLFWKKHFCAQCGQRLDKSWDECPYCAQGMAAEQAAPAAGALRTQAFMVDAAGSGPGMQLLGWLVPLKGPMRGELFTLSPVSVVGTDPSCTVILSDHYMSAMHAEIKAEGGVWVLRDLGSTNGTFVNDKRVDRHELVDNDFVVFGQSLVKFKTL